MCKSCISNKGDLHHNHSTMGSLLDCVQESYIMVTNIIFRIGAITREK